MSFVNEFLNNRGIKEYDLDCNKNTYLNDEVLNSLINLIPEYIYKNDVKYPLHDYKIIAMLKIDYALPVMLCYFLDDEKYYHYNISQNRIEEKTKESIEEWIRYFLKKRKSTLPEANLYLPLNYDINFNSKCN